MGRTTGGHDPKISVGLACNSQPSPQLVSQGFKTEVNGFYFIFALNFPKELRAIILKCSGWIDP